MPEINDAIEGHAERFDALREFRYAPGETAKFLIVNDEINDFQIISELNDKWWFEYSKSRSHSPVYRSGSDVFKMSIAKVRDDADLVAAINRATYIEVEKEFYVIRPTDTLPPSIDAPFWKIYCEQHSSRDRFSVDI